uniref:Sulfate transport system permease protein n=1 Tax=Gronococcus sybilensis TaxID=3028029 RepID=A0A9Y1I2E2_9RHOD|nr:sulfate transport system permease protein [Gronococcus sybilensis]
MSLLPIFIYLPFLYLFVILIIPTLTLLWEGLKIIPNNFLLIATQPIAISSYKITLLAASVAVIVNTCFGLIISWILARYEFPGKRIMNVTIDLPFALPTSVAGLTLSNIYRDDGIVGSFLQSYNISLTENIYGIIMAMIFVSFPFMVRTIQPVIQEVEKEIEEASWVLGAFSWETFYFIILPSLLPTILTGVALSFSRAIGEYGSIVIISSNIPYKDLTTSVLVAQRLEQYDYVGATVIGIMIISLSFIILIAINLLQLWSKSYG